MPNYDISNCLLGTPIVFTVSATTLLIGDSVRVNQNETEYCGLVIGETESLPDADLMDENLLGCCDCISNSYSSLVFTECGRGGEILVDILNFCETYGNLPRFNSPYWKLFNTGTSRVICVEFIGVSNNQADISWIPDEGPFESCESCLFEPTQYSAGTESTICVVCCPCTTGETVTSVSPPHPVWSTTNGNSVVLLNAITLGGMNGLNN